MKMNTKILLLGGLAVILSSGVNAHGNKKSKSYPGYVVHGINSFNDKMVVDYSTDFPLVPFLSVTPSVKEIGVYNEGAQEAGVIDENTDLNLPVATTSSNVRFFNPGAVIDQSTINQPLDAIASNFFGFSSLTDRVVPVPYDNSVGAGVIYRSDGINPAPTVGEWNEIAGEIDVKCRANGTSKVKLTVHDAFPNAIYTIWDVGSINPLTSEESGYAAPFGGLPNHFTTNRKGCATKTVELPYCLTRKCEAGADSCSSYISIIYHWDGQVYGGSPAGTFAGIPGGVYAGNQMFWPVNGDPLEEPSTRFKSGKARACNNIRN